MLPPGHVAAGYLASATFIKLMNPQLPLPEQNTLLLWGMFFSFAPDLDFFYAFKKARGFVISEDANHRKMYSHAPVIWLVTGLLVSFCGWLSGNVFIQMFGLLLWLGSWSHFILDSLQYGIMWLWPLNRRLFALRDVGHEMNLPKDTFFRYWFSFVKTYATDFKLTFYPEVAIIVIAIITYFRS